MKPLKRSLTSPKEGNTVPKQALSLIEERLFPVEAINIKANQAHLKTLYFLKDKRGTQIEDLKSLDIPKGITFEEIKRRNWKVEAAIYVKGQWTFKKGTGLCRKKNEDMLGDNQYCYWRQAYFKTGQRKASGNCSGWRSKGGLVTTLVTGLPQTLKERTKEFGNALWAGKRMAFTSNRLKQEIEKTDIKSDELDILLIALYNYIEYHIGYFLKPDFDQELAHNLVRVINSTRQAK